LTRRNNKTSLHKFLGLAPPPSKNKKTVETCREYEAEKRMRSFQSNWLNKFTWLEHKTDKMYCKVCLKYEKTGTFVVGFTLQKVVEIQKLNWSKSAKI
jgi:hypothetical protein